MLLWQNLPQGAVLSGQVQHLAELPGPPICHPSCHRDIKGHLTQMSLETGPLSHVPTGDGDMQRIQEDTSRIRTRGPGSNLDDLEATR